MGFGALQRQGSKYPNCSRVCYLAFCGVLAHKPGCFEPLRTQRNHMFPTLALHGGFSDSCFRGWGDRRSRILGSNMRMKQSAAALLVCLQASSTPHPTVQFSTSKLPPNSGTERKTRFGQDVGSLFWEMQVPLWFGPCLNQLSLRLLYQPW